MAWKCGLVRPKEMVPLWHLRQRKTQSKTPCVIKFLYVFISVIFVFKLLTLPLMTPWKYFCTTGVNVLEKVLLCTGETLAAYTLQKLSISVKLYLHSRRDTLYQSHFNSISDTVQKEYQLDDWHHQLVSLKFESLLKQMFFGN